MFLQEIIIPHTKRMIYNKLFGRFFLGFSSHNLGSIPQIAFFGGFCKTSNALRRGVRINRSIW